MSYSVKYKKSAQKKLEKFDACVRTRIKSWIEENLSGCVKIRVPRDMPLKGICQVCGGIAWEIIE